MEVMIKPRFLPLLALLLTSILPLQAQVPEAELEALYGAAYPGVGVRAEAIVGAHVIRWEITGIHPDPSREECSQ